MMDRTHGARAVGLAFVVTGWLAASAGAQTQTQAQRSRAANGTNQAQTPATNPQQGVTGPNSGAIGSAPPSAYTPGPTYTPSTGYYGGYYPGGVYYPYGSYSPSYGYYTPNYNNYNYGYPANAYPYGYGLPNPNGGFSAYYRRNGSVNRAVPRNATARTRTATPRGSDSLAPLTPDQERTARQAEQVMSERPLREGTVVKTDAAQVRIRFSNGGASHEDSVPTKQVFFFRKDGGLVTAANAAELLQTGDRVLFPDPTVQPTQAVAGQRQESRHGAPSLTAAQKSAAVKHKAAAKKAAARRKKAATQ